MWEVDLFYFNSSFPFISDIRDEIIHRDDGNTLEGLLSHHSSFSYARDGFNRTLLHCAAYSNSTSCLRVLLRFAPYLVDAFNWFNDTPLMRAVLNDNREVAKILLRAGADVRVKNVNGRTVFDHARLYHLGEMLEILKQHQQVSGIF